MNRKLIELIKTKFKERLQAKTGWGRTELLAEFDAAVADALLEMLDAD